MSKTKLSDEDLVVLDGVEALIEFDTARARVYEAVAAVGAGPILLNKALTDAFLALLKCVEHLSRFREAALGTLLSDPKKKPAES